MSNYKLRNREYEIKEYDPIWRAQFYAEAQQLKEIFGSDIVQIEHVGSTSVPGLCAKPTIDILILVDRVDDIDKYNKQMSALGYNALGDFIAENTRLFEKEVNSQRVFIVHVFEKNHLHSKDMTKVRDYLIANPEEAKAYGDFKKELKKQFPKDYVSYRKQKNLYMDKLTKKALSSL